MTTPPALVIFDNDGVLVDSERLSNRIFAELITSHGLPTTFTEAVERYMGRRTTDCVADIEAQLGRPLDPGFVGAYEARCAETLRAELTAVDGVVDVLDRLDAAGVPYCIASSGTPDEIALRLAVTGLADRFGDRVYSGSMVARGKPAPDLFEYAADRMGVAPGAAVVVEDSPPGVVGAKAAGATVIGHAALLPAGRLAEAGADHVVTGMTQVPPLLGI
ncbi:HAD superfamily hydrolase (TIGR01509 family) [Stackebrandtia albiflava]|uniref:HAD superfamily hydrolase (TIGR01509 family) n=1 Tax=Stackebrandtia albiflava TaxID=406432 RepID=A0A562V2I1_9ACTN|nr:HAD family phosphatase [Stackebrandtia albiflava]TWJ12032.1 HAD superfamily hydrolase (TIGR01509 family) [Stackebrandtia albiflava]